MAKNVVKESKMRSIRKLYGQCLKAYQKHRGNTQILRDGIPAPSVFDDLYYTSSELLYREICSINKNWKNNRSGYERKLLRYLYDGKGADCCERLIEYNPPKNKMKKYEVFFEIYYVSDRCNRLFGKTVVGNSTFEWSSKKEIANVDGLYVESEHERRKENTDVTYLGNVYDYKVGRRFPKINKELEKNIHVIKATVYSSNSFVATNDVLNDFRRLVHCIIVSRLIGEYSIRFFDGNGSNLKTKIPIVDTGVYIAYSDDEIQRYYSNNPSRVLPTLRLDKNREKDKFLKRLIRSINTKSPVQERIVSIIADLAMAFSYSDAGVRQLSFWRCLEHATKRDGENVKEKEIIKILKSSRRNDEAWRQMGELILLFRNRYVHEGILIDDENICDYYLMWSQKYAEEALLLVLRIFDGRKRLNTNQKVEAFIELLPRNCDSLDAAKYLIHLNYKEQC